MKIYCYIDSVVDKEVSLGMLNLSSEVFCSCEDIKKNLDNKLFNYGDIILLRSSRGLNSSLIDELSKLGVATRVYKGGHTNLTNIKEYDSFISEYIKKMKSCSKTKLLSEARLADINYSNLLHYIKADGLLSKCNTSLYNSLIEVKNTTTSNIDNILDDLNKICNKHNISMADLVCLTVKNIEVVNTVEVSDELSKVDETKNETKTNSLKHLSKDERYKYYIEIVKEYVNDTTGKGIMYFAKKYGIPNDSTIYSFCKYALERVDRGLYKMYKYKAQSRFNEKSSLKSRGISREHKLQVVTKYVESGMGVSLSAYCDGIGESKDTISRYIKNELKDEHPELYKKCIANYRYTC